MAQFANLGAMSSTWRGPEWHANTNAAQQALATDHSGSAEPALVYPFMRWWDTGTNKLKMRNPSNSGWVEIGEWTGTQFRPFRDGTALGTAATRDHGNAANQLVALDASARLPAVDASQLTNLPAVHSTGDVKLTLETSQPAGWLFFDGKTLGTVASGATYAGTSYQALFTFLWDRIAAAWCPLYDSGGGSVARGASAAADWAANRRLALPDARGCGLLMLDSMGGTAAGRVTSASTGGSNANAMAARGGAETHTLTTAQLPVTSISATARNPSDHSGGYNNVEATSSGTTGTVNVGSFGSGQPHNNMGSWFGINILVKV